MLRSDRPVQVVVVDDHPFFRDGMSRGLTQSGLISVVAVAESGRDGIGVIAEHKPQVAVVDYQLPDMDGISVTQAIIRDELPTKVLIVSAFTDSAVVFRALEVGVCGYVSKDARRSEMVDAVLSISQGRTVLPPELAGSVAHEIRFRSQSSVPILSERESQVLRGFARGLSIPQLSRELFIGASTVKSHTQRLYEKLGVSDRAAAVAEGMRRGLLE